MFEKRKPAFVAQINAHVLGVIRLDSRGTVRFHFCKNKIDRNMLYVD